MPREIHALSHNGAAGSGFTINHRRGSMRVCVTTGSRSTSCSGSWAVSVRKPQVLFLLVLVVHLLIEFYGALHGCRIAGTAIPTSDSGHSDPEPGDDFLPEVLMAIGVYLPDTDTRCKLVMEAVLSELKKMRAVVDSLSAMYARLVDAVTGTPSIGLRPSLASLLQVLQDALHSAREWWNGDELS
ncbi:hypothetical protein BDW75DRAFT_239269 [Aspergillus navahoensis]